MRAILPTSGPVAHALSGSRNAFMQLTRRSSSDPKVLIDVDHQELLHFEPRGRIIPESLVRPDIANRKGLLFVVSTSTASQHLSGRCGCVRLRRQLEYLHSTSIIRKSVRTLLAVTLMLTFRTIEILNNHCDSTLVSHLHSPAFRNIEVVRKLC